MRSQAIMEPTTQDIAHWQARQEELTSLLESWGATQGHRAIDWPRGYVIWRDREGDGVVRATARALCSYDRLGHSLLMAWAGEEAESHATIPATEGVPTLVEPCSEGNAWLWAMHLAEQHGASYLYRFATESYLVFLGLWSVEALLEEEIDPAPEHESLPVPPEDTPQGFVIGLLDDLRALLRHEPDVETIRRAFHNHGRSLHVNAPVLVEDGADPALLSETEALVRDMEAAIPQRRFSLLPTPALGDAEREKLHRQLLRKRTAWLQSVPGAGEDGG